MNEEEHKEQKLILLKSAIEYVSSKLKEGKKDAKAAHPLNRGDIMILIMLIDKELPVASSDWKDPLNGKRLAAIREKLGQLSVEAPKMSKAEAQQFQEESGIVDRDNLN